jgi:hypothetical protein
LEQVKQTPEDHLLVIKITPGDGAPDEGGENLQGTFVPKSELSLWPILFLTNRLSSFPA